PAAQVREFFDPSGRALPEPYLLPGLWDVAGRIGQAIESGERVAFFGDYDADGVTSAAIVTIALRAASRGALPTITALPSREAGYGMNRAALEEFAQAGATLLIAADCGSSDHEHVAIARSLGMDVVILDHHEMHGPGPDGAIVASARLEEGNLYRHLPAAGLCLLLATALAREGFDVGDGPGNDPVSLVDLAMVGIIADVCDLRDPVNRALVRDGLRQIRRAPRPGLRALIEQMKIAPEKLNSRAIGMQLAPAINAAGRQDLAEPALQLLLSGEVDSNTHAAAVLGSLAWVRETRAKFKGDLLARLEADGDWRQRLVLVFEAEGCPHGLAGTLAGELVKDVGRPVIVLTPDGEAWRGSARSVSDFDIGGALQASSHLLLRNGGHRMAAGLQVHAGQVDALRASMETIAREKGYVPDDGDGLEIHADLPAERLTLETLRAIDRLRPFG
ncbi:MAG: single-stranded-DNA-specific exonuclease RecJ, partial [Thermomicrobiales bacterium]